MLIGFADTKGLAAAGPLGKAHSTENTPDKELPSWVIDWRETERSELCLPQVSLVDVDMIFESKVF